VIPVVLVGTALRPEELFGLYRSDVTFDHDRRCGAFTVQRRYTKGELKEGLKTGAKSRRVPFGRKVYDALRSMPTRLDSEFLFTAARGGPVNREQFAAREWTPAVRAAGLEHRPMYAARHTAITWWLAAGVPIDTVAAWAGTSIKMIDQHYRESIPAHDEFAFAIDTFGVAVGD
jgi:integrase